MSDIHVPLTTVDSVRPHPNADKLDIAVVKGWQVCVAKGSLVKDDCVIYCPPDAILPDKWATAWGVKPYLSVGNRVKAVKLRGEPSIGFAVPLRAGSAEWQMAHRVDLDTNVADLFGITKYMPPVRVAGAIGGPARDRAPEDPRFHRYSSIENLRHAPHLFDGLDVVISEKVHGANSRVGFIDGVAVAGSHRVQRLHPQEVARRTADRITLAWYEGLPAWKKVLRSLTGYPSPPETTVQPSQEVTLYWKPFDIVGVHALLKGLSLKHQQVILYGELYGPGIQALTYGVEPGKVGYVAFDLLIDGKFVEHEAFEAACRLFGIPMAPVLAVGDGTFEEFCEMAEGDTMLGGGPHMREGVVIKTLREPRVVAKLISDSYLTGKGDGFEDLASDAGEAL